MSAEAVAVSATSDAPRVSGCWFNLRVYHASVLGTVSARGGFCDVSGRLFVHGAAGPAWLEILS